MAAQKGQKRTVLGEDGELREVMDDASQPETIFCTKCGTTNAGNAVYCRRCGANLEEQAADAIGAQQYAGPKGKRLVAPSPEESSEAQNTVSVVLTMLLVVVMGIVAMVHHGGESAGAIIPIAIGWLGVESVRSSVGNRRNVSEATALVRVMTTLVAAGLTIAAIITGNGGAVIPIMIGWAGIEAIRSAL